VEAATIKYRIAYVVNPSFVDSYRSQLLVKFSSRVRCGRASRIQGCAESKQK